eukprot:TCONS_00057613-protein
MMVMKIIFSSVILVTFLTVKAQNDGGFFNIAHMCNNIDTLDWAVREGANAIEADLQFDDQGNPKRFYHGAPCDCNCMCNFHLTCYWFRPHTVCYPLSTNVKNCDAEADVTLWMRRAATKYSSKIALIWLDSKVKGKGYSEETLRDAARNLINVLEDNLFSLGYKGVVLIGAEGHEIASYFNEVSKTTSTFKDRIYVTMDSVTMKTARNNLDFTNFKNIIYNNGMTGCSPRKIKSDLLTAIKDNVDKGVFSAAFTWTYNLKRSMRRVAPYFNGIITNSPPYLNKVVKEKGLRLAIPGERLPEATSSIVEDVPDDEMYDSEEDLTNDSEEL